MRAEATVKVRPGEVGEVALLDCLCCWRSSSSSSPLLYQEGAPTVYARTVVEQAACYCSNA